MQENTQVSAFNVAPVEKLGGAMSSNSVPLSPSERLTAAQWSAILDVEDRTFRKRLPKATTQQFSKGGMTAVYTFEELPADYQTTALEVRTRHLADSFTAILHIRAVNCRNWSPSRPWESYNEASKERGKKREKIWLTYNQAVNAGRTKTQANEAARKEWRLQFGKECNERQIRRLDKTIMERGGEHAPREAFLDEKSCDHVRARNEFKLAIPEEFIEEFRFRTSVIRHLTGAYNSMVLDWKLGKPVAGLGTRGEDSEFPYTLKQLRDFAVSTAARDLGVNGRAKAKRDSLPFLHTTTANLKRFELLLLDDTRIDIIAARDRDGFPVELKAYLLMDVASRQIVGYVVKEEGAIQAEDVWALLASVLSRAGLPLDYPCHIKFERGAVACSAAAETLLKSIFPGRIEIHRTSMNGGRNHKAGFLQQSSGNWMGKSHIERFMSTLATMLEHIAGQRGGDYRRQSALLGLDGKNRKLGLLTYTAGSQIHEGARGEIAERVGRWLKTGDLDAPRSIPLSSEINGQIMPVRWVRDAIRDAVAFYNDRRNHRMEGFNRIEIQEPATGALKSYVESPNDRAAWLETRNPTQRISPADAASLLKWRGRAVTISRNGVTFDCAPWKGLRFHHPDSRLIHEISRLTTGSRKYVALFDPEAIRAWTPECGWKPEIHILGDLACGPAEAWRPGDEGRYLETLPLESAADRTEASEMATQAAAHQKVIARAEGELLQAARPAFARALASLPERRDKMEGYVALIPTAATEAEPSPLYRDMETEAQAPGNKSHESHRTYAESLPLDTYSDF